MLNKILPKNEHRVERAARIVVGAGLLSLAFVGPQTPLGLIGAIPLLTGLIGSCPLYTLFGISTCRVRSRPSSTTAAQA